MDPQWRDLCLGGEGDWGPHFEDWAPRFWPEGRREGPAEGGRGEETSPHQSVLNTPTEGRQILECTLLVGVGGGIIVG